VEVGQVGGEDSVLLLGERPVRLAGPEPGLDVAERDLSVIARQRRGQDGRRIALGEDEVRCLGLERLVEGREGPCGDLREPLPGAHQPEVEVGGEPEVGEGPVEQLAMLAGRDEPDADPLGLPEPEDDRRHLDGLGPSADHANDDPVRSLRNTHRSLAWRRAHA
jgi:hypothetical protein